MRYLNPRLSIRNGLYAVAICALVFLAIHRYQLYRVNYSWPDQAVLVERYRALTPQEIANISRVGSRQHSVNLRNDVPSRGLRHWQQRASSIQPEMTEFALLRHMPQAARYQLCTINGLSMPDDPQVSLLMYAVDSELAFACVMQYERVEAEPSIERFYGRVKNVVGFFPHDGELNDFGVLSKTKFDIKDRIPIHGVPQDEKVEP